MTATLHADADVMHLIADLIGAGHTDVIHGLMTLHVDPYQANDLVDAIEVADHYIDRDNNLHYLGYLPGGWRLHLIEDRTVDPDVLAAAAEPWPFRAEADARVACPSCWPEVRG